MDSLYILLAFVLGWLIAQSAKVVITLILRKGKLKFSDFLAIMAKSGGMPSGHTASFVAATLTIGFRLGFSSAIFALAACNTIIIIYDATNVRYAVGQQGKLLNKIVADTQLAKPLKLVEGHTVAQAIVGFIIGVLIAVAIQFVTFGKIF